jgi:hypothetical protein
MKEYTFDSSINTSSPAQPPNFEDKRTVQTARPVVPLEQIEAKVRHRRQWFLGGAFAIAMMLGAASALLASYLKLRNTPTAVNAVSQQEVMSAPLVVAESVPADAAPAAEMDELLPSETEIETETEAPKKQPATKRPAVVKQSDYGPDLSDSRKISEEEELEQIRNSVLVDEWQERRARRVWRRERRMRERYHHRDLSNLDEIFEGRRKRP